MYFNLKTLEFQNTIPNLNETDYLKIVGCNDCYTSIKQIKEQVKTIITLIYNNILLFKETYVTFYTLFSTEICTIKNQ